ncbi:expressed unknown protein [Seminavis robusta]|uniref:Uncharacterized protein n=1 Tax=Seminavis robusta TaxID=568900 RepID=A0A9N8DXM7_9STRA|nr:expressed unknown protein [Seminavis robusta]|eukprot:Sro323_g117280.1 n/a (243) ;mRNA; r:21851-22579
MKEIMPQSHRFIVFQTSPPLELASPEMDEGDCQSISEERLQALDNRGSEVDKSSEGKATTKGWNLFSFFFDDSAAPALTDCSSRSSSQDLDLSVVEGFEYFKDPQASPDKRYLKRVEKDEDGPKTPVSYLPSVLRRPSPRSVSFSGVETVFELDDTAKNQVQEKDNGLVYPKTPVNEWYAKGSSAKGHLPPGRHALPPLATTGTYRRPHLQPRRSALKKPEQGFAGREIQIPVSPKITWYAA